MGRIKKMENETPEDAKERKIKEAVSNQANRSEKTSWHRKYKNMQAYLQDVVAPLEEEILEAKNRHNEALDEVAIQRTVLVNECIHPHELLVINDDHIVCKFCNKRMSIPNV